MGLDALAAAGRAAVLSGAHDVESPPDADGPRWGPSVILRPDPRSLSHVGDWTSALLPLVGPHQWATGSSASAHVTVRTLDARRSADSDDDLVRTYANAIGDAGGAVGDVRFRPGGILLSPISVMLALVPVDDAADRLAAALERALGPAGWFEASRVRDAWYLNLVHFTGPIADVAGLTRWVDAERSATHGWVVAAQSLDAVRWAFDGRQMIPRTLARVPIGRPS